MTKNLFWRFSFSNFCIISYRLTFVKNFLTFLKFYFLKLFGSDRQQLLYLITDLSACQELFKFFWKTFWTSFFRNSVLFCQQLLHLTIDEVVCQELFLFFLKNFFKFLSSSSATSDIIPYTYFLVNNFFYFFEKNFKKIKNRAKQPHFIHILLYISLKSFILSWTFL